MLDEIQIGFLIASSIILFLYGLDHFSREIEIYGKEKLGSKLNQFASNKWKGFALGALFTACIQSSTATTTLAVSLVNSGFISFSNSLAILFGANVGTTLTAQIVALKLTFIGPFFITLGFIISLFFSKFKPLGRIVFYFGFIFFGLDLIATSLSPLRNSPEILSLLKFGDSYFISLLMGTLVTFIVQSSSVSTGMIVMLVQQQALSFEVACFMVLGANIGTTGTALIASLNMNSMAKKAALSNLIFNILGVLIFYPFMALITLYLSKEFEHSYQAVATLHLFFNLFSSLIFLILLKYFTKITERFFLMLGRILIP